jgi:alkaline phosphatase D
MSFRTASSASGQASISASVRPQPVQSPRFTLQMLRQGDGTAEATSSGTLPCLPSCCCNVKGARVHKSGTGLREAGMHLLGRRQLVAGLLGGVGLLAGAPLKAQAPAAPRLPGNPFTLGVAAGDPDARGFVLWTRLAPKPFEPLAGLDPLPYPVRWQVADDEGFRRIVAEGEALARPELGYSVHAVADTLRPGRSYHYRFLAGAETSSTGRARTLPAAGDDVRRVRLAVAGCQDYQSGLYTAFAHLAREDVDAVFHYGDYIYEGGPQVSRFNWASGAQEPTVRQHNGPTLFSLDDYRRRYTQTRLDPDLQAAHASAAFLCSFDDHEVVNNWVGEIDPAQVPADIFRLRRAAAMQAWYEFMPVRPDAFPGDGMSGPWRHYRFGTLLDARQLNTRNFRTDQPCGDKFGSWCEDVNRADAEVIGRRQEDWLVAGLTAAPARWNALLQQIMMMDLDRAQSETRGINVDSWAGYTAPRDRLLQRLAPVPNLIVLTGDEHQHFAGEVRPTGADQASPPRAIEFVTTSASSGSDGPGERKVHPELLRRNPGLKYVRDERGYSVMTVTPSGWETQMKVVDTIRRPGGKLGTAAAFRVPAGAMRLETL